MNGDLAIRNFSHYQHYKDRPGLPWVKFYVALLDDEDFAALPAASRLVGCLLLLVAQRRGNRFPNSSGWLAAEVRVSEREARGALADLQASRFLIQFAAASESASDSASDSASEPASEPAIKRASEPASPRVRPRALGEGEGDREERAKALSQAPKSKERKPDPLWDVFERELGPVANKAERSKRNAALKLLREAGATPGELVVRIGRYKRLWPGITLTEHGVASNWTLLETLGHSIRSESEDEREQRILADLASRGPR